MSFFDITNPTKYTCEHCNDKSEQQIKKLVGIYDSTNIQLVYEQYKEKEEDCSGWKFDVAKINADYNFHLLSHQQLPSIYFTSDESMFEAKQFSHFFAATDQYGIANGLELIKFLSII